MRSNLLFFLMSALILMRPPTTRAVLVPNLDLESLCNRADLIVVGVVADVRQQNETTIKGQPQSLNGPAMIAELNVRRVLKGQLADPKISFKFILPAAPAGIILRGQYGIFFFREAKAGIEILDRYHPYVVAAPSALVTTGTCLDQVTAELGHAATSEGAPPRTRREAVEALRTISTPAATLALRSAAQDSDANTRILAIAALLARGNIDYLDEAVSALLSAKHGANGFLIWRLASSLEFGVRDRKAIPALVRLLRARYVPVRRAAAAALRNTHDRGAIEPLAEALHDPDREVQYQAVIGLAEITGAPSEWSPASGTFDKDPKKYLDHWRDWAKTNK
jgi:hypothetical protein